MKGFDFYKKVKGRKRHILVDSEGLLMAVQVTVAHVPDQHQAFSLLQAGREQSIRLKKVWVDEGYHSNQLQQQAQVELDITVEIVPKPNTGQGFQVAPRRRVWSPPSPGWDAIAA